MAVDALNISHANGAGWCVLASSGLSRPERVKTQASGIRCPIRRPSTSAPSCKIAAHVAPFLPLVRGAHAPSLRRS
jgi:hypothetical protein